jgi:hypothetical protein
MIRKTAGRFATGETGFLFEGNRSAPTMNYSPTTMNQPFLNYKVFPVRLQKN